VLAVALMVRWTPPAAQQGELARAARIMGEVEVATGDVWRPIAEARVRLAAGIRIRTGADGRAALALAGGESLRLASGTEVMLDAPGRLYVQRGTVYVDSGERPAAARVEIVTPAGTARDLGTQFELQVAGAALRLRVREGMVVLDRGGQSLTGRAGEQVSIDGLGAVSRTAIAPEDPAWQWAESIAPMPDMDGKPAAALIAWVARETGRQLHYESPLVEQRATAVILHGDIRHLAPIEALEAMLATTDLVVELRGDTMEVRARSHEPPGL
jgi:ferric-dicitrate binding protein FerR (iron transport regulator)